MRGDEFSDLLLRIKDAIGRISMVGRKFEFEDEVHCLAKELAERLTMTNITESEFVELSDAILESTADFLGLAANCAALVSDFRIVEGEVIDPFVVLMKFLRNFLLFATRIGAELQNVLYQIQPIAINPACVFTTNVPQGDWFEEVQSKCSTLEAMVVDSQLYQACAKALSVSRMPSTVTLEMEGFLDSLISLLWNVLRHSMIPRRDQLLVLYERLRLSRATLKHRPEFWSQMGFLICDAGILICSLHQTDVEIDLARVSDLLQRFDAQYSLPLPQASEPNPHSPEAKVTGFLNPTETVEQKAAAKRSQVASQLFGSKDDEVNYSKRLLRIPSRTRQRFDFEDDEIGIYLDGLMRGSKQRRILLIAGMPGMGKTTLASQLYNLRSVNCHFHTRAWCTISQVLDMKKVLLQLLTQIDDEFGSSTLNMSECDLANKLRQCLKWKRYLIFLDDVWTSEVWHRLEASFLDDSYQSRIILTSRSVDIVPHDLLVNGGPFMLRLRTDHECLRILRQKLFPDTGWDPKLLEFGMLTARKCNKLPLTAAIVAGILATQATEVWKTIMGVLSVKDVSRIEQCQTALELSYMHLPIELRICFTYFGVFPEDQEIPVTRLIQLWMGEGFVGEDQDVAREYLEKLINRSLVTVVQDRSIGGPRICKIHDLLSDFCRTKAKQHRHYHLLQRHDQLFDFNEPSDLQRLCIHSDPFQFKESRLFCPLARSILFFLAPESSHESCLFDLSFIIQIYRILQVINMEQIPMSSGLPSDTCLPTSLKFLSVQINVCDIPASIGDLSNLETFIGEFWSGDAISFPLSFWNLQQLKYLHIRNSRHSGHGFRFPNENLDKSPDMPKLETLSGVVFHSASIMEEQIRKFPNIRSLKCCILPGGSSVVPETLIRLESLSVRGSGKLAFQITSTGNLRKLTLNGFGVSRAEVAAIGMFPVLEVLNLENTTFLGGTLEIEDGEFSGLRVLHLGDYDQGRIGAQWGKCPRRNLKICI